MTSSSQGLWNSLGQQLNSCRYSQSLLEVKVHLCVIEDFFNCVRFGDQFCDTEEQKSIIKSGDGYKEHFQVTTLEISIQN